MKNGHFLTKKWEFLKRSVSGADFLHPGVFELADHEFDVIFDVGVRPEGVNGVALNDCRFLDDRRSSSVNACVNQKIQVLGHELVIVS